MAPDTGMGMLGKFTPSGHALATEFKPMSLFSGHFLHSYLFAFHHLNTFFFKIHVLFQALGI